MRRAVVYVSGEPHYRTPELWWHLRLQKHPTNFATNRVDQLLSASILELLMLVGVEFLKEAENRQPWVVNGLNALTPDSREACQAIAFYDNFTPEKSRPIKIEPLSIT